MAAPREAFDVFRADHRHPGLQFKKVGENPALYARVGRQRELITRSTRVLAGRSDDYRLRRNW